MIKLKKLKKEPLVSQKNDKKYFLGIDLGNTTLTLAVVDDIRTIKKISISSKSSLREFFAQFLSAVKELSVYKKYINHIVICSVVPRLLPKVKAKLKAYFKVQCFVIGEDIKVPIKNKYQTPDQVGQDRLLCAYAARELYGYPSVVIDLGTAITFDVVTKKGEYDGGAIVPGINMSAESLFQKTALLPNVEHMKSPKKLIGKNTEESILSGLFFGYGALCNGMIDMIAKKIGGNPVVVVTGGHTDLMKRFISHKIECVNPDLVFSGMACLKKQSFL